MCLCDRALDVKAFVGWSDFSQPGRCVSGVAFVLSDESVTKGTSQRGVWLHHVNI